MAIKQPILDDIIALAATLSPEDRRSLAKQILEMANEQPKIKQPHPSLFGVLPGLDLSDEEIEDARHEMLDEFPREDIK